jgi:gp210
MKPCSKCGEHKPKSDFFVRNTATGTRHAQCKQCYKAQRRTTHAEHYRKNQAAYQQRAKQRRERLRVEFRYNMLAYLRDKSCAICGEDDVRVLEFDHINPKSKRFSISQAVRLGYSWPDVVVEMKKCRILCANCHKRHTAQQMGWYKAFQK